MMDDREDAADELGANEQDALAATGRALSGLVPMFGGVVGELITKIIPDQRTDRIVAYVRDLNGRLEELGEKLSSLLLDPENIDLIEEGGFQAARATTAERIELIATMVANGLAAEDADVVRRKRLARLLGELDNDEVMLLDAYGQSYGGGGARDPFANLNRPEPSHMGSSVSQIDAEKLYEVGRENLLRLGLLEKNYRNPPRGQAPIFDTRKGDYEHSVEISYLGRLLLRFIARPSSIDTAEGS